MEGTMIRPTSVSLGFFASHRPGDLRVGGLVLRGPEAPRAATGEVGPDPFALGGDALCVDLNAEVRLVFGHRRRLVGALRREGALPEFEFSVAVGEQLGGVGARRGLDGGLFGGGD